MQIVVKRDSQDKEGGQEGNMASKVTTNFLGFWMECCWNMNHKLKSLLKTTHVHLA